MSLWCIVIVPSFLICHLYIVRQSVAISGALLYFQMTLSVHTYKKNSGTTMNRQLYRQCTSVPSLNYSVQCTSVQSLNYSAVCTLCRQQWIAWEPEQGFCQRQGLVDCCMILHSSIHFMYDTNMKNWMSVSHSILADLGHSHHTLIAYCRPPYSRIWGRQCCLTNHTSSQTQVPPQVKTAPAWK